MSFVVEEKPHFGTCAEGLSSVSDAGNELEMLIRLRRCPVSKVGLGDAIENLMMMMIMKMRRRRKKQGQ